MTNPLALSDVSNGGLRLLAFVSEGQTIGGDFWEALRQACKEEMQEREKAAREREICFDVPFLPREECGIVVNEIRYLAAKLGDCPDDSLVLLIAAAGLALEAQLQSQAVLN